MPPKEHDFNEVLLDEERNAHKWLQRFVLAAPISTAPLLLIPLYQWIGGSSGGNFLICLYSFVAFMTEWSYIRAAFGSPGKITPSWSPPGEVTYVYPEKDTGTVPENRYCEVCDAPKPPRTSHCKYCARCVPKMDHHCGWTSNCVGEKNHKFFVLFVFYMTCLSWLFTGIVMLRVAAIVINAADDTNPAHMGPGQIMMSIFGIILSVPTMIGVSSLLISQTQVILSNHTMLERLSYERLKDTSLEPEDETAKQVLPYDLGRLRNFKAVFGENPWTWWLPISIDQRKDYEITNWPLNRSFPVHKPARTG